MAKSPDELAAALESMTQPAPAAKPRRRVPKTATAPKRPATTPRPKPKAKVSQPSAPEAEASASQPAVDAGPPPLPEVPARSRLAASQIPSGVPLHESRPGEDGVDTLAGELGSRDATPITRRGPVRGDSALSAARTTIPTCLAASVLLPILAGGWLMLPVTSPLKIGTTAVPLSLLAGGLACVLSTSVLMNYVTRRVR